MNDQDFLSKSKSKSKLRRPLLIAAALVLLVISIAYFYTSRLNRFLIAETKSSLHVLAQEISSAFQNHLNGSFGIMTSIATYIGETSPHNISEALPILKVENERNGFKQMGVVTTDGLSYTTDGLIADVSSQSFFKKAMAGENVVSDILNDTTDSEPVSFFASPIYSGTNIIGVIFAINPVTYYKSELSDTSFERTGYAYVIKDDGTVLFRSEQPNTDQSFENIATLDYTDGSTWAPISDALIKDESGVETYTRNGQTYYMSFSPIQINDWNILLVAPKSMVSEKSNQLIGYTLLTWFIILLFFTTLLLYIRNQQTKSQALLTTLAYKDRTTGYSNWNKFSMLVKEHLSHNTTKTYAIVVFDIDKFKIINDLHGYQKGNQLLVRLSEILLCQLTKENETFCRVTADDFALFLAYDNIEALDQRIRHLKKVLFLKDFSFPYTLTFGVYPIEIDSKDLSINALFDRADMARKSIKSSGNGIAYFDAHMRGKVLEEAEIEAEMKHALNTGEFKVYLQPKYSLKTLLPVGAEALVRWQHPTKGLIPPNDFIPLFEKNNFVLQLDYFMFRSICQKQKEWIGLGLTPLLISVNFSRNHLNNPDFCKDLIEITEAYKIPPECLELEVTESAVFDNMTILTSVFKSLKDYGFKISIDDFGSGYSSLNLLKELPVDVLKMDKDFFSEANISVRGKKVVESVIQMAKSLDIKVVAEGVETEYQINFLKSIGCDIIQGYYFAKPMPLSDYEKLIYNL